MFSRTIKAAVAAAGLMALLTLPSAVEASSGPFAPLSGSWAGAGTITTSSGAKERIRCRAKYAVNGSGSSLDLTLRCASDSYSFELQSTCNHLNGAVSGTWSELTRHVGGSIEGSVRGNNINVRASGIISAMLAVSTKDNSQSISIQAPGTEMQHVAISLSRK
ncbi:MAG: hypothetical protein K2Z80_06815 [Xanthobacteraceae bacterium]|nr:hypothetical protein [Xanthobacteraceae bacterium]